MGVGLCPLGRDLIAMQLSTFMGMAALCSLSADCLTVEDMAQTDLGDTEGQGCRLGGSGGARASWGGHGHRSGAAQHRGGRRTADFHLLRRLRTRTSFPWNRNVMCVDLQCEVLKRVAVADGECVVVLGHVEDLGVIVGEVINVPLADGGHVINAMEEIGCEVGVCGRLGDIVAEGTELGKGFPSRVG